MALYTILPRFEYCICINNISIGNVYGIALGRSSIVKPTAVDNMWKILLEPKINGWPNFLTYVTSRQCFWVSTP